MGLINCLLLMKNEDWLRGEQVKVDKSRKKDSGVGGVVPREGTVMLSNGLLCDLQWEVHRT